MSKVLTSFCTHAMRVTVSSAASAVAGRIDTIISTASTKLKSRFFMCFLPVSFFSCLLSTHLPVP